MDNEQLLSYLPSKDVVFAGLHGSRAYGLDNKDSDYDLKFVWKLPLQNYLSVEDIKDTGYSEQLDNTDVTGWELRHFLRLVQKSNMTVLEVLQTENLLNNDLFKEIFEEVKLNFNRRGLFIQYSKAGRSYLYKYGETDNIKYYNNSLRCLASAEFIYKYNELPSICYSKIFVDYSDLFYKEYNISDIPDNTMPNTKKLDDCFRRILFT